MIELKDKKDCSGCSACASKCNRKAIQMVADEEGFVYPVVDRAACNNCGLCNTVCPIAKRQQTPRRKNYRKILALRTNNDSILFQSSSGGFFYTLATYVLQNKGCVAGAVYDKDFVVRHTIIESQDALRPLMGSKYVQSVMGNAFENAKSILDEGRLLLFTGTPCQIDGLKSFLKKEYDNLLTVDVLCHAVPSPLMFREYLGLAHKKGIKDVVDINMRNKKFVGWNPATSWGVRFKNGSYSVNDYRIINWSRLFFSELLSRPSCHDCQYANLERSGDFSMGDYWDRQHYHDELFNKKGTSLVFINSEKASKVFEIIRSSFTYYEISEEASLQPCLFQAAQSNPKRSEYWALYRERGFETCYNQYFAPNYKLPEKPTIKEQIKAFIIDYGCRSPWKFPEEINNIPVFVFVRRAKGALRKIKRRILGVKKH